MCKIIEEVRKEERLEAGKYPFDEISNVSGLSLNEVKELQEKQGA